MSVSLCTLRIEIDEDLPEMGDSASLEAAKEQKKRDRGVRESKTITVETYASKVSGQSDELGILPTSSRRSPPSDGSLEFDEPIGFFCGNPLVEVTKGIIHVYKENELRDADEARTLCLLSVPVALGAQDLLSFAAACQKDIAHVRVLRDGSPEHYMALLTFRSAQAAREFHTTFDGVPYSSLEPSALCHAAWVQSVEWGAHGEAPPHHTELPVCPVCLERMDESVAGVLSVQCAHAFHAECLRGWRLATCPVCRAAQTPEPRAQPVCQECAALREGENEGGVESEERGDVSAVDGLLEEHGSSLWICLICGHVACGRYDKGHAAKHFKASNHTYAMQLGSNRVWDYAGDTFVHRLVQNKPDGKLVATGEGGEDAGGAGGGGREGKGGRKAELEAAQLDLAAHFTEQLATQLDHYRADMHRVESAHQLECEELRSRAVKAESRATELHTQLQEVTKENKALEKKLHHVTAKLSTLQSELSSERGLCAALASSQAEWQATAKVKEDNFIKEISELKEQLRDVMFFVEARGQLAAAGLSSQELSEAAVSVPPPARPRRKRR